MHQIHAEEVHPRAREYISDQVQSEIGLWSWQGYALRDQVSSSVATLGLKWAKNKGLFPLSLLSLDVLLSCASRRGHQ